jgi:membrane-associated protease RseP (regulator of RpoE activity)
MFLLPTAEGIRDRFVELRRRLAPLGLLPLLRDHGGRPALILVPKPPPGRWAWQTNALLFLATIGTTFAAGYIFSADLVPRYLASAVTGGIEFSASLLLILVAHEMGHKLVSIRRGIDASLPYFIPMIPIPGFPIGTLGAVIITRTPAPNRDSLMELGASGPIAGFLVAIPVLIYGVIHSFVITPQSLRGLVSIPDPLLVQWLVQLLRHPGPEAIILAHPVYFAGWIGLFVTSLNLLPSGMLDGGHAVRAAFGARAHRIISIVGVVVAALMGAFLMAILMAVMMRRGHVGPIDDLTPMSLSHRLIGAVLVVVFALSVITLVPLSSLLQSLR